MKEDRVALVTGGSRGIGAEIAAHLAARGYKVALTYRERRESAEDVASSIRAAGGVAVVFRADAGDASSVRKVVEDAGAALGPVDVLVNNIGKVRDGLAVGMRDEFDDVIVANLRSTFLFTRAVVRSMLQRRGGRVINVTSMVGRNPGAVGQCNYVAAKAAVHAFTRSVALELAPRGITVNAIAPGLILTDLSRSVLKARPGIVNAIPLRRLGEKREVASLVAFLASDDAAYITGEVIGITGGMCL